MSSPGGTVYMLKKGTGKLGYEGVFEPHKGKGFHAKLRLDPHSKDQFPATRVCMYLYELFARNY